jgi:hypothetical protein
MIRMSSRPSARARVWLLIVIIICQSLGRGVQGEGLVADCKEITREIKRGRGFVCGLQRGDNPLARARARVGRRRGRGFGC